MRSSLQAHETDTLFLSKRGLKFNKERMTNTISKYIRSIGKRGSCHLIRHTTATQMLENGASIRHVQELLGHSNLDSTQIYTQVSITKLKEVHEKPHPAKHDF